MAFSIQNMLGANLTAVYTPPVGTAGLEYPAAPFAIGTTTEGSQETRFIYVTAAENIDVYDAVAVDEAFAASQLTSTEAAAAWKIGVAIVDIDSGQSGWVQTRGPCTVFVQAACAADTRLVSTATAGALDDSTTVGVIIKGIVATATNTLTVKAAVAGFMAVEPFADIPAIA